MNQEAAVNRNELHKLLRGWRWRYKGRPVGKWAVHNKVVWKEERHV